MQDANNSIFLLCFEFPPVNSGGSQRPFKFAKQLRQYGYNPIILTPEIGEQRIDTSLQSELEAAELTVITTPINSPNRWTSLSTSYYFNIQDDLGTRWYPHLRESMVFLVQTYQPALLFATLPPFSMGEVAMKLAKEFHLPLVLDWRDAWSQWNVTPYASRLHYALTLRQERRLLDFASHNIVTSEQTRLDFLAVHPALSSKAISVITNSYEGEPHPYNTVRKNPEKITIGYVGSFYYNTYSQFLMDAPWWKKRPHQYVQYTPRKENWLYRTPWFLFEALALLQQQHLEQAKRIEVVFAGKKEPWFDDMVQHFGVKDRVRHIGWLTHEASLAFQSGCDALLLTSSKVEGGRDYSIAGKTFEYFKLGKPIIGFICEGAQRDLLAASGQAILCDPDNAQAAMEKLYQYVEGMHRPQPDRSFIEKFETKQTTEKLARVFDELCGNSH